MDCGRRRHKGERGLGFIASSYQVGGSYQLSQHYNSCSPTCSCELRDRVSVSGTVVALVLLPHCAICVDAKYTGAPRHWVCICIFTKGTLIVKARGLNLLASQMRLAEFFPNSRLTTTTTSEHLSIR